MHGKTPARKKAERADKDMGSMIVFHQNPESFHVEEELFYQPSGAGSYVFVKIRKRGLSTFSAKRQISERTGVPVKHIRHAGLKDTAATAVQWLSWPDFAQKSELGEVSDCEILELTRHENNLTIGHVRCNHFQITLETGGEILGKNRIEGMFPNYFGPQRFGRSTPKVENIVPNLLWLDQNKFSISVIQGWLFNEFLRRRFAAEGKEILPGDLWTATNGKRYFQDDNDPALAERFAKGEIFPTGPIYGFKIRLTEKETGFLKKVGLDPPMFRRWGKMARGARRPLYVKPEVTLAEQVDQRLRLHLKLPSGSYATVYLLNLLAPKMMYIPIQKWPDLSEKPFEFTP